MRKPLFIRHLYFFIVLSLLFDHCFSQNLNLDPASGAFSTSIGTNHFNIKRETIFYFDLTKNARDSVLNQTIFYDLSGNITKRIYADPNAYIDSTLFFYNDQNKVLKEDSYKSGRISSTIYKYDSNGNKISEVFYNDSGRILTAQRYIYRMHEIRCYYKDMLADSFLLGNVYYFDDKARPYRCNDFSPTGNYSSSIYNKYSNNEDTLYIYFGNDKKKKLLEELIGINKKLMQTIEFSDYPFKTKSVTNCTYNPNGTLYEELEIVDDKKKWLKRHYYFSN